MTDYPPRIEDALWLIAQGEHPEHVARRLHTSPTALEAAMRRARVPAHLRQPFEAAAREERRRREQDRTVRRYALTPTAPPATMACPDCGSPIVGSRRQLLDAAVAHQRACGGIMQAVAA